MDEQELTSTAFLESRRAGSRPRTTPTNPHTQLDQNAPPELQERIIEIAQALPGVVIGPSGVSVPGARAFHLPSRDQEASDQGADDAFMVGREFGHLHPASDGSMHMTLPPEIVARVVTNGWAEPHPLAGRYGLPGNIVMIYGPRDEEELKVIEDLLRASHAHATAGES